MGYNRYKFWAAIRADGTLWGGGVSDHGELGSLGSTDGVPQQFISGSGAENDWAMVATGEEFTLALKNDGTLWGCGTYTPSGGSAYELLQVGSATDWAYIAAGETNGFAINSAGELWGFGTTSASYLTLTDQYPVNQPEPVRIGTDTDWAKIRCSYSAWAQKTDGTFWGWGYNYGGTLCTGDSVDQGQPSPIPAGNGALDFDVNGRCGVLVAADGTLWCAGFNTDEQFGGALGGQLFALTQIGTDTDWAAAVLTSEYTSGWMLALKTDGTVWSCGTNGTWATGGFLGLGDLIARTTLEQIPGHTFGTVCTGLSYAMAIDTDGQLWGWGSGYGALLMFTLANPQNAANGDGVAYQTPVAVESALYSKLPGSMLSAYTAPPPPPPLEVITTKIPAQTAYQVVLTGAPDGLSNAILPASSASIRLRSGASTYLSVAIPWTDAAADAITDRPTGELIFNQITDDISTEVSRVNPPEVRPDQGPHNSSITLTGYRQTTNADPHIVALTGLVVASGQPGARRYRCAGYPPALRPGDTARFIERANEEFIVGMVTLTLSPQNISVEITEAV